LGKAVLLVQAVKLVGAVVYLVFSLALQFFKTPC
jgi:hypothetical protein